MCGKFVSYCTFSTWIKLVTDANEIVKWLDPWVTKEKYIMNNSQFRSTHDNVVIVPVKYWSQLNLLELVHLVKEKCTEEILKKKSQKEHPWDISKETAGDPYCSVWLIQSANSLLKKCFHLWILLWIRYKSAILWSTLINYEKTSHSICAAKLLTKCVGRYMSQGDCTTRL